MKTVLLLAVPPGVVTVIAPVLAAIGTWTVIVVGVSVLCPGFVKTRIHESARNMPDELASYNDEPAAQLIADLASQAVNAGIDAEVVAGAVENAIRTNKFWILTHERSAVRTTELRLEWMRGGPPMRFDLMAATKP